MIVYIVYVHDEFNHLILSIKEKRQMNFSGKIHDGRKSEKEVMILDTCYGRIFNIQRFSVHDGPGARTTVFFKGCNLHCVWCHNPESISAMPVVEFYPQKCIGCGECFKVCQHKGHWIAPDGAHLIDRRACTGCLVCTDTCYAGALAPVGKDVTAEYVMKQIETDIPYYKSSGGGVTFSGGEAMLQIEFLARLLAECKTRGIHTAVDTAGNVPWEYFEKILHHTDLFLFDVKAADPKIHKSLTGVVNDRILNNLYRLAAYGARIFVRIPFVPSCNRGEMEAIASILTKIKPELVEIIPYHKLGAAKYAALGLTDLCCDEKIPSDEEIEEVLTILKNVGLCAEKS